MVACVLIHSKRKVRILWFAINYARKQGTEVTEQIDTAASLNQILTSEKIYIGKNMK